MKYIVSIIFLLMIVSCSVRSDKRQIGFFFNTQLIIQTDSMPQWDRHIQEVFAQVKNWQNILNMWQKDSLINQLSQTAYQTCFYIPDSLAQMIENALWFSYQSQGKYDLSIGPLVRLWYFQKGEERIFQRPPDKLIQSHIKKVNYQSVHIQKKNNKYCLRLEKKDMILDLGSIAKGYVLDELKLFFIQKGSSYGLINFGGSVVTWGSQSRNKPYKVGLQNPFLFSDNTINRGDLAAIITIYDEAISTAGVYEQFNWEEEQLDHHILDAQTGYPIDNNLLSVSVIGPQAQYTDILSTVLFILGEKKGRKFLSQFNHINNTQYWSIYINKDKKIQIHFNPGERITWTESAFQIKED